MVVDQIKQIDKNADNQIDGKELIDALTPNGFFSKEDNLVNLGNLLNSKDIDQSTQELFSSLEQSFYSLKDDIIKKENITDDDVAVLNIYIKVLGGKCEEECREIQKIINRHDMKKIMGKDEITIKDIATLQNYLLAPAEISIDKEQMQETQKFIDWRDISQIIQKPRITKAERAKLDKYKTDLLQDNQKTDNDLANVQEIEKYIKQQDELIQNINSEYENMDLVSKKLLSNILGPGDEDLITKIDNYLLSGDIKIDKADEIKGINLLNNLIRDDFYSHEKLEASIDESVKDMMHVANIKTADIGYSQYTSEQVMAIQLWANVCYGKNLSIDGQKVTNYSFKNQSENSKLTSTYIYRLEFITRSDVIGYRHDNPKTRSDDLLDIPELDEILDTLSIEDQDKLLIDFLDNCYLRIRQSGVYFENQIQGDNLKLLLDLAIKEKTEGEISIDEGIKIRQQLIKNLENTDNPQKDQLISAINDEINFLSQKNSDGNYLFKNMGEYYKNQYENLKQTINKQRKENVDMNYRYFALKEWNEILKEYKNNKLTNKSKLKSIVKKIETMYCSETTTQYRKWMEEGEVFDPYIITNIAIKFSKLTSSEQKEYNEEFRKFMKKRCDEVFKNTEGMDFVRDIIYQIDGVKSGTLKFEYKEIDWQSCLHVIENTDKNAKEMKGGYYPGGNTPWLKDVYKQYEKGTIKLVIGSYNGYPELFQYKENENGDILLYMYNREGVLDISPKKIISKNQIDQANKTACNVFESIETPEFHEVMKNFENGNDKNTFLGIQNLLEGFVKKYNSQNLTDINTDELKKTIADMMKLIDDIDIDNLKKLKNILQKISFDSTGITNKYEQIICTKIDQINILINLKEDKDYRNQLSSLANLKSNDKWYERISPEQVLAVVGSTLCVAVGILCSVFSGGLTAALGSELAVFLFSTALTTSIGITTYFYTEQIQTARNYKHVSDKIVEDSNLNKVRIPGYVAENTKTNLYKFKNGEITFGDYINTIAKGVSIIVLEDFLWSVIGDSIGKILTNTHITNQVTANVVNIFVGDGNQHLSSLYKTTIGVICGSDIIFNRLKKMGDVNELKQQLEEELFFLGPITVSNVSKIDITCKKVDKDGNRFTMQYSPYNTDILSIKTQYLNQGGIVDETGEGLKVKYHGKIIEFEASNVPSEYRVLSSEIKANISDLGGVKVNEETGQIFYKNPEGLTSLRGLGSYLDMTGQGELFIDSNGNARLIVNSSIGQPVVINIYPQTT